jgi:SpoVK/Ycf46/Vps4 family AAA+-type ATPase
MSKIVSTCWRGPPGCGKTSVIKGILNETKRHAVVVQWSRIQSCAEFSSLFRSLKIGDETYSLGELCYIFEDFDANKMDLLKKRKNISNREEISTSESISTEHAKKSTKNKIEPVIIPFHDELTLDYVLNVFDGIIELYNALIIFTTNAKLEYFDPALIRPGRIDTILEMKQCSRRTTQEIVKYYLKLTDEEMAQKSDLLALLPENRIRPSELEQICMNQSSSLDEKIASIMKYGDTFS